MKRILLALTLLFGCSNHNDHSVGQPAAIKNSTVPSALINGNDPMAKIAAAGIANNENEPIDTGKVAPLGTEKNLVLLDGNQYLHCNDLELKRVWTLNDGTHTQIIQKDDQLLSLDTDPLFKTYADISWNADDCEITKTITRKEAVSNNKTEKEAIDSEPKNFKVIAYSETNDTTPHHTLRLAPCLDHFCTQLLKNEAWDLDESTQ